MRKITTILLTVLLVVCVALGLCACNKECKHEYGEWTVTTAATCEAAGEQSRACLKCNETQNESIAALGHDMQAVNAQAPTCEDAGWGAYEQCSRCDHNTKQEITALGHEYSWESDENEHWKVCTHTGCTETKDKGTHTFASGETVKCSDCGASLETILQTIVGDGTKDSVDITLALASDAGRDVFAVIKNGIATAKDGSVNLTITGAETISPKAFEMCAQLGSITLGKGVKQIGAYAFAHNRYMTLAVIETDVIEIGDRAFWACDELAEIKLSDKVTTIGEGAFDMTAIESITLPNSVTEIGAYIFGYCLKLKTVVLSDNIETIPANAFCGTALKSIALPSGLKTIGDYAFQSTQVESLVIPDSVTSVGKQAFFGSAELKSITFGKGVTKLSDNLFFACTSLTEITFLSPITEVVNNTFYDAKANVPTYNLATENVTLYLAVGQKALEFDTEANTYKAANDDFTDGTEFCGSTFKRIVVAPTEIDASEMTAEVLQTKLSEAIVAGKTNISVKFASDAGSDMFAVIKNGIATAKDGSVNLTITGAETIPQMAFAECTQLKSITFGDGVKTIGQYAFAACTSIEIISLGSSVETIAKYAFVGCEKFTNIDIPNNIKSVEYGAFAGSGLQSVTFGSEITTIWIGMFKSCLELKSITVPEQITTIEKQAFEMSGLTSIILPDTVTSIGESLFCDCESLESVTFGKGINSIPESTFMNCISLKTVNFSSSITTIKGHAFSECGLVSIEIPSTVTEIETSAFEYCKKLTSVTFIGANTNVEARAFDWCENLAIVIFESAEITINEGAFYCCTRLANVTFGSGVTTFKSHKFSEYAALSEVKFTAPLESVESGAFDNVSTANVVLNLADGQKNLVLDGETYVAGTEDFVATDATFCGRTFKQIRFASVIDTSEMTTEQIAAAVTAAVEKGVIDFTVKFAPTADVAEFGAVFGAINDTCSDNSFNITVTGVTKISTTLCYNYSWLKSITFGDGMITLGEQYAVMSYCGELEQATIGKSVKTIGGTLFNKCGNLEKIVYEGTVEEWNAITKVENWVKDCPSVTEVICSDGTVTL